MTHPMKQYVDAYMAGDTVRYKANEKTNQWREVDKFAYFDNPSAQFEVVTVTEQELIDAVDAAKAALQAYRRQNP